MSEGSTGQGPKLTWDVGKVTGSRDVPQIPSVEVTHFSQIEAQAARFGVTRADVAACLSGTKVQDEYAYLVVKGLTAQMEHPNERDAVRGYPVDDLTKARSKVHLFLMTEGDAYSTVTLNVGDADKTGAYSISRTLDTSGPKRPGVTSAPRYKYDIVYTGSKSAALARNDGTVPYKKQLFGNDRMNRDPRTAEDLNGIWSMMGGFPENFLAPQSPSVAPAAAVK